MSIRKALLFCLLLLTLLCASFIVGVFSEKNRLDAANLISEVYLKIDRRLKNISHASTIIDHTYQTVLVDLSGSSNVVPTKLWGTGGGLTSMGDDLLLITYEGSIYIANGPDDIRLTNIQVPDYGLSDYKGLADLSEYSEYQFSYYKYRYNDIEYYINNGVSTLAISYTEFHKDRACYTNTVAVLDLPSEVKTLSDFSATLKDWNILYRTKPCLPLKKKMRAIEPHMAGGKLQFVLPNKLYMTSGDYHWDGDYSEVAIAQLDDYEYGKIIEINTNTSEVEIFSKGHRNPQGLAIDDSGQLWSTEHGPKGGDELNRIVKDANYGWPDESFGVHYIKQSDTRSPSYGRHESFQAPVYAWLPSVGLSSVIVIKKINPSWNGDLLAASIVGRKLFRIRLVEQGAAYAETIDIGYGINYVHEHNNQIVLWTTDHRLFFLSADYPVTGGYYLDEFLLSKDLSDSDKELVGSVFNTCVECHSLGSRDDLGRISLAGVYGQVAGTSKYSAYSPALKNSNVIWNEESLANYIKDPSSVAQGTYMLNQEIENEMVIQTLVEFLESLK